MSEKIIELEVKGIDIFDENVVEFLQENFPEVQWSFLDGKVIASFVCQESSLNINVQNFVRGILVSKIGASNFRWHDDLVGYAEISLRTGLSSEGVRKWAKGERGVIQFPEARGHVGTGQHRSPVWCWSEVYTWLDTNGKYSEGIVYPTSEEICALNAAITWIKSPSYQVIEFQSPTAFEEVVSDLTEFTFTSEKLIEGAH